MKLKNTIKEYRQKKSLTQEELAFKVGVSRQTIISIERYRYKPSLELGMKISMSLEININSLFYLE
ncbi:MAG: helix-turn-helix transcriptional regulator [Flavobacteriaceae bacterium]|nr:helix-turn-helix transcriptional regulator [Flavobacteriaceae bacterium]